MNEILNDYLLDLSDANSTTFDGIFIVATREDADKLLTLTTIQAESFFPAATFNYSTKSWMFKNGSILQLMLLDSNVAMSHLAGQTYSWIGYYGSPMLLTTFVHSYKAVYFRYSQFFRFLRHLDTRLRAANSTHTVRTIFKTDFS